MTYGPVEIGIRAQESRPYGSAGLDEQEERTRRQSAQDSRPELDMEGRRAAAAGMVKNPGQPMHADTPTTAASEPQGPNFGPKPRGGSSSGDPLVALMQSDPFNRYVKDLVTFALDNLGRAKDGAIAFTQATGEWYSAMGVEPVTGRLTGAKAQPEKAKAAAGEAAAAAGEVAGGVGEAVATPFIAIYGGISEQTLGRDPLMGERFNELVGQIPEEERENPTVRAQAMRKVIEEFENAAYAASQDTSMPLEQRTSAAVLSGLLKAQQFSELGGPSMTRALLGAIPKIQAYARTMFGRGAPVEEQAAAVTAKRSKPSAEEGKKPAVEEGAEQPKPGEVTKTPEVSSPAPTLEQQAAEATRMRLAAIAAATEDFSDSVTTIPMTSVGPTLAKALREAEKGAARLALRGIDPESGVSLAEIDRIINGLDLASTRAGRGVPETVMQPLREVRAQIYDETRIADMMNAANKRVPGAARRDARQAESAFRKAETKAGTSEAAVATAEDRLVGIAERLRAARGQAQATAARKQIGAEVKQQGAVTKAEEGAARADERGAQRAAAAEQATTEATQRIVGIGERAKEQIAVRATNLAASLSQRSERLSRTLTVQRTRMRIVGDSEAPEVGYMDVDDALVWEKARMHTGKYDSPAVREAMVAFIREHGDEVEEALRHLTLDEITGRLAAATSADPVALARALPKTGELARRVYVADQVLGSLTKKWMQAGKDLTAGRITATQMDGISAEVLEFARAATEGTSELGRGLGAKRLLKREAAARLVSSTENVKVRESAAQKVHEEMERLGRAAADAMEGAAGDQARADAITQSMVAVTSKEAEARAAVLKAVSESERAAAYTKLDAARGELTRLEGERGAILEATSARVQKAEEAFAEAAARFDQAQQDYETAVEAAAILGREMHKQWLEAAVKLSATPEQLRVLAQLSPDNVQGILTFLRDLKPLRGGEVLETFLLNNTYGSIPSLQNNFINTGQYVLGSQALIRPITELVTGPIAGRIAGVPSPVVRGETKAAWMGLWSAIPDAFRFSGRHLWQGEAPEIGMRYGLMNLNREAQMMRGGAGRPVARGPIGILPEGVLRVLTASDGFWKVLASSSEMRALTFRNAALKGGDTAGIAALTKFTTGPSKEQIRDAAAFYAQRGTFNDPATVDGFAQRFLHLLNSDIGGLAPLRILIPAARFGISAARHSLLLSGGGVVAGARLATKARGVADDAERLTMTRQAAQQMAEGAVGAVLVVAANQLYDMGTLTGSFPTDPGQQAVWRSERRQESSILIGGQWVPMSFFGPLAAPFLLTALMRDQQDLSTEAELGDRVERASVALGKFFIDIPAFNGTYQLLDALYGGVKYGWNVGLERFLSAQLSKVVAYSATLRSLVPVWDPLERDAEALIETISEGGTPRPEALVYRIQARIPAPVGALSQALGGSDISSTGLPALEDRFGRQVERPRTGLEAIGPLQAVTPLPLGDVERELVDTQHALGEVAEILGGQKLSPREGYLYAHEAGIRTEAELRTLITSPEYKVEDDPRLRQQMRQQAIDRARNEARSIVVDAIVNGAKTPEQVARAVIIARAALPHTLDEVMLVARLKEEGRLSDDAARMIDEQRGTRDDTQREPSVSEMLTVAPLLTAYQGAATLDRPAVLAQIETQFGAQVARDVMNYARQGEPGRTDWRTGLIRAYEVAGDREYVDGEFRERTARIDILYAQADRLRRAGVQSRDPRYSAIFDAIRAEKDALNRPVKVGDRTVRGLEHAEWMAIGDPLKRERLMDWVMLPRRFLSAFQRGILDRLTDQTYDAYRQAAMDRRRAEPGYVETP